MNVHLKILKYLYRNQQNDWTDLTQAFSKTELEKHSKQIDRSIGQLQSKKYISTPAFIAIMEDPETWPDPNIRNAQITLDGIDYYESKTVKFFNIRMTRIQLILRIVGLIGISAIINWYKNILIFFSVLMESN